MALYMKIKAIKFKSNPVYKVPKQLSKKMASLVFFNISCNKFVHGESKLLMITHIEVCIATVKFKIKLASMFVLHVKFLLALKDKIGKCGKFFIGNRCIPMLAAAIHVRVQKYRFRSISMF